MTSAPEAREPVETDTADAAVGCDLCITLLTHMRAAADERDLSGEVDARIRYRRHMLERHGERLPFPI
ncbi:hypothetical protein [Streptomyces olivaceiscleroticus]|uniref:Uncharacterized protein n=1 Tax=Streptomyces olivaceiscleroticus TaxID=68245 RepID=A0ABP3KTW8_9ACTN